MNTKLTVEELIAIFIEKGGRIDKYYLRESNRGKHTILYLKGWFGGKNIREALTRAIA